MKLSFFREHFSKGFFKDKYFLSVLVLTVFGFILRIYSLSSQSIWMDESFSMNAAYEILEKGIPLLDSGAFYGLGYLLHLYLMAFFILLFPDVWGARFLSVIFGTLTIPLAYYFAKTVFDDPPFRERFNKGFLFALIIAFSTIEIAWSRQARMYSQFQFFFLLSLLLFYRFNSAKNFKNLVYLIISSVLSILTHPFGFTLFLIYLFYYILNFKELILVKKVLLDGFSYFTELRQRILLLTPVLIVFYIGIKFVLGYNYIDISYFTSYLSYLKSSYLPYFYLGILGLFFLNYKRFSLFLPSLLIPFLFISYLIPLLHYRYLFFFLPLLFLLMIVSIEYISSLLNKDYSFYISLILIVLLSFNFFTLLPVSDYTLEKETPQPDFKNAFNFVKENLNENDIVITPYPTVARVYGVDVDFVLDYNPSKMKTGTIKYLETNRDWYTNTAVLDSLSFNQTLETQKGFLIVDTFYLRRGQAEEILVINNLTKMKDLNENLYSGVSIFNLPQDF